MAKLAMTAGAALALVLISVLPAAAEDWPQWGRDNSRNMASPETGLPAAFEPGKRKEGSEAIDPATTKNVRWVAKLGSQSYGNPTVFQGRVYVGTNNEAPRDPKFKGDRSVVMAFDETSGELIWQLAVPKLGAGKVSDWEYLGICSSPQVDPKTGDLYVVTNLGEVVKLDADYMKNGNDGPFKDEAKYLGGKKGPPIEPGKADGDLLWRYDMRGELGVFPHNVTSSSVLLQDGRVYANTSNGVDWSHINIPSPGAPALIALDAKTGKLVGEEAAGISRRLMHSNWSTPAYGVVGGVPMVVFCAGDGWCYGFDPKPKKADDGLMTLSELWRYDCNPPEYRMRDGKKVKYATRRGPSEIIASPVIYGDRVYVAIGQDPEHGEGVGALSAIDATKRGDITESGRLWRWTGLGRTLSTAAIADGRLYIAELGGLVHAVDIESGKPLWEYDTGSLIWSSPVVADGKVYIGNEDGMLVVLAATAEKKKLAEVELSAPIYSSVVVANGTLYVASQTHLYAVSEGGKAPTKAKKKSKKKRRKKRKRKK